MSHIYCPECGFQSPEAATYCSRCGALIARESVGETTLSLGPDEIDAAAAPSAIDGPALVVRSGGGRAGESFEAIGEQALIGRSPECDVFLDDVTVSRRHAELVREGDVFMIRDLGSLNGTFVNRRRIESSVLEDDDEVQIGKYRMTFLAPMTTVSRDEPGRAPAHDRRGLRAPARRVPRHLDLEDPLPRGPGPAAPEPDAGRLPALLRGRRRAPGHDPAAPARRVPAAAGDPRGASRADRRPGEAPRSRAPRAGGRDRHGRALRAGRHLRGVRAAARGFQPARTTRRGWGAALHARARPTSRSRARGSPGTGSTPGTSGPFGLLPAASRRCSSRSSPRRFALATPSGARRRSMTSRPLPSSRRSWHSSSSRAI